jgi:helicase
VQWLSGAVPDASALHALFADTFNGAEVVLLTDEAATASAIRAALTALAATADSDDAIVTTYAGHGSTDHFLIPYDGDINRLADTAIGLDELADLISAIPGQTLFCALDCCFSGGLGARVFSSGLTARGPASGSTVDALDRFTGDGVIAPGSRPADVCLSPSSGR